MDLDLPEIIAGKKLLILDMNGTFMFGHDRFSEEQDYWDYYRTLGGELSAPRVNRIIRNVYKDLSLKYASERFRLIFPSVREVVVDYVGDSLVMSEVEKIVATFSYHEIGKVPQEYARSLQQLAKRFCLAGVFDIWSPKEPWLEELKRVNVKHLFAELLFSSDHGMVKPSPKPYRKLLRQLEVRAEQALVISDSTTRDLAAARAAGIDCILVGKDHHHQAIAHFETLLEFNAQLLKRQLEDFAV